MPSNNSKYSVEMREKTVKFILDSGKSATSVAEELGIDTNTVCRWVRDYRRKNNMPSYAEEKGVMKRPYKRKDEKDLKIEELKIEIKKKDKQLEEEKEKVEILKKSLRIFMEHHE
ncbi:MAG: transposase [Tenericutes bacterium]|nr:transposase [Mycoplasmatota bacterium]